MWQAFQKWLHPTIIVPGCDYWLPDGQRCRVIERRSPTASSFWIGWLLDDSVMYRIVGSSTVYEIAHDLASDAFTMIGEDEREIVDWQAERGTVAVWRGR